jgi:hypothetical protein
MAQLHECSFSFGSRPSRAYPSSMDQLRMDQLRLGDESQAGFVLCTDLAQASTRDMGTRIVEIAGLEGNVVVGDFGGVSVIVSAGGALVKACSVAGCAAALGVAACRLATVFAAAGEQGDVADDDFGAIDFFAGFFVVPTAGSQAAFGVELVALFDVVADDFSEFAVGGEIMPFGSVLPVTLLVLVTLAGGDREVGYRLPTGQNFDFGIFAYVAEEDDFVYAFCHENAPMCKWKE